MFHFFIILSYTSFYLFTFTNTAPKRGDPRLLNANQPQCFNIVYLTIQILFNIIFLPLTTQPQSEVIPGYCIRISTGAQTSETRITSFINYVIASLMYGSFIFISYMQMFLFCSISAPKQGDSRLLYSYNPRDVT